MLAPIVLVHGIFGFDQIRVFGLTIPGTEYFRGIAEVLRNDGHFLPAPPVLNTAGRVTERAADLKRYLETNAAVAGQRVHLIAHSMGGLDSRHMITHLGMADRVISLSTIGTPHHGSPIADLVMKTPVPAAHPLLAQLGINVSGMLDLTSAASEDFNKTTPEAPGVHYFSIAGEYEPKRLPLVPPFGLLGWTHDVIADQEGANDGMVSTKSARFGQKEERWTFSGTWLGNHFNEVNWGESLLPLERADPSIVEGYRGLARHLETLPL